MVGRLFDLLERFVGGALVGLLLCWGVGVLLLPRGVPDWWLLAAFALGFGLPVRFASPGHEPESPRALSRGWLIAALLVLLVALTAVAYGAVATPSRHWDGAAAFDAKVFWLAQDLTVRQPFFADPAVFHHSPDYPLLLPLLTASLERWLGHGLGRLSMPLLYVLLVALVGIVVWRRSADARLAVATALATGLTPALLGPGGGAVDSGYGEPALLLATTAMAAGLLLGRWSLLGLGTVLAIASKPEGLPYAFVAMVAAFVAGRRHLLAVAALATALALALWVPLQRFLLHLPPSPLDVVVPLGAVACCASALWCVDALARRGSRPARVRWGALGCAALAGAVVAPLLRDALPESSSIGLYLKQAGHVVSRLSTLPAILTGMLDYAVLRGHFGATYVVPLVALHVARPWRSRATARGILPFVVGGLAVAVAAFVLSPEPDLQHHLRSSMPRLLLHWIGPAWLLTAACLASATSGERRT